MFEYEQSSRGTHLRPSRGLSAPAGKPRVYAPPCKQDKSQEEIVGASSFAEARQARHVIGGELQGRLSTPLATPLQSCILLICSFAGPFAISSPYSRAERVHLLEKHGVKVE